MSASVGDVVELLLKREKLLTNNVLVVSNFLKLSKDDGDEEEEEEEDDDNDCTMSTIHGFKHKKLIHAFNKRLDVHEDIASNIVSLLGSNSL